MVGGGCLSKDQNSSCSEADLRFAELVNYVALLPKLLVCPAHVVCHTLVRVGLGDRQGEDI